VAARYEWGFGEQRVPGPPAFAAGADVRPLSSSQIYNLGTGTGYSVLQMVQAMEKASGREVGAESLTPVVLSACLGSPHDSVGALCRALAAPCPTVMLSLQIKYKITGRREGDVAACYANPELAERELGWKAAFGLDKMCKNISSSSSSSSLHHAHLPTLLTASFPVQVRTCGAGSCRIPQDTARTEPRPKGSFYGTGFRGLPPPLPPCFLILTPPGFLHLTELSQGPASLPRALNPLTERSGTWNRRVLGGDAYCRRGCIQCSDMVLGA